MYLILVTKKNQIAVQANFVEFKFHETSAVAVTDYTTFV